MEEAQLLAQVSLSNGLPYIPQRDGFVFSSAEINRAIDRDNRLKAARQADFTPREPAVHQSVRQSAIARAA
ncbi:MAG: hypothetical protein ABSG41_00050 [Bryobacteraceae bacterium]|jgi:hypothetical protein